MKNFEAEFAKVMSCQTLPMDTVLRYVAAAKGKRLRPRLVFLTAQLFGEINASTRRTALFVELVHTATLLHDDVVDQSEERRGQLSVNARWDNRTAVLAGDYLLSKAMMVLSDPMDHRILMEMLETSQAMSEGELLQNATAFTDESRQFSRYLDVITRKTARLIKACCVGGALSVGASAEQLSLIGEFGLNFGMVFQMRDDVLDADAPQQVAMAESLMPDYLKRCKDCLEAFPASDALEALKELTVFCAERDH